MSYESRMDGIDYRIDDLERDITTRLDALEQRAHRIDDVPLPSDQPPTVALDLVTARTLLLALEGPGHLVHELQANQRLQGEDSPIYKLRVAISAALTPL